MNKLMASLGLIFHSGIAYILVSLFFIAATIWYLHLKHKEYKYIRDIRNLHIISMGYSKDIPKHIRDQVLREFEESDK